MARGGERRDHLPVAADLLAELAHLRRPPRPPPSQDCRQQRPHFLVLPPLERSTSAAGPPDCRTADSTEMRPGLLEGLVRRCYLRNSYCPAIPPRLRTTTSS